MGTNVSQTQQKIEELESIRGVAAFLIVLYHIPKWHPIIDTAIKSKGYLMVDLFFVLSGFVICHAYADRIKNTKDLLRFQFLRFARLYPVHILFLVFFGLIELAKYVADVKFGIRSHNSIPFKENNLDAFIKSVFLISSVLPNQPFRFNIPAWSISVEFYTYFLFALSVLFSNKAKTLLFGLLVTVSFTLLVTDLTYGFDKLLHCFTGFFIGCLTAIVNKTFKIDSPRYIPILILAIIVVFIQLKLPGVYDPLIYLFTALLIYSLVASRPGGFTKKILGLKVLTWLGTISYSLYMSHSALLYCINAFVRFFLKKPEIKDSYNGSIPQLSEFETLLAIGFAIPILLVVSTIVYYLVEKPMREKSRNFALSKLN